MSGNLQGKVALVTGASRGIGKGIAIALGEAGALVYITGRNVKVDDFKDSISDSLLETKSAVEKAGGICVAVPVDHSDDEQIKSLFEQIEREQNGQLDLLVNNAYGGVRSLIEAKGKPFWEADLSLWNACNQVGLRSHYVASHWAAKMMTKRKQGLIVTISSWGGLAPIFGVAYGTGKSGCDRLASDMAVELKPFNVASISLWPGIVGTEQFHQLANGNLEDNENNLGVAAIADKFNWETPLFVGRVITALCNDSNLMQRNGKVQIVAELANYYGVVDEYGHCPASLRSLRFLLPQGLLMLKSRAKLIPDLRVPWWLTEILHHSRKGLQKERECEKKGVVVNKITIMESIVKYAQGLVYSLICLMPSVYQKASLNAILGLFLEAQGHPYPEHTQVKSASALSRFLNHYNWSTRGLIRATRLSILGQIAKHRPSKRVPLKILIDLTTLEKCGKFLHLSNPTKDEPDPWVRILNGKRGLHLVVLYLVYGEWRVPWSFRVWRGKGYPSPSDLACKLLGTVPKQLTQGRTVIVLADTEFSTVKFFNAVQAKSWRIVVGVRNNRHLQDGRTVKQLYRHGKRGQQVLLEGLTKPLTISWFWLKRADSKRELRFVVSSHPYSGAYLVMLGRKRWAIEGFFKTVKHRFGLHCFGQSTKLGVYRWLILSLLTYLLAHWIDQWSFPPILDWKATCDLTLSVLFPSILWLKLLRYLQISADIAARHGFEIILKPIPT